MMAAIVYGILFAACLMGIICYPKIEGKINGVKAFVAGGTGILVVQGAAGGLFSLLHVRAVLLCVGMIMLLAAAGLWYGIWRKKRMQRLFFRMADVVSLLVLALAVCLVSVHMFGADLNLQYPGAGAAENFAAAMRIVRGDAVENAGFATVIEAVFIRMYASVTKSALYFKGFILADIFLHLMEVWMFYVVMISLSEKKVVRMLAPFFCIFYFWGYPAYNYMMGNDDFFVGCAIGVLFVFYVLRLPAVQGKLKQMPVFVRALPWVLFAVALVGAALVNSFAGAAGEREMYASMYGDLIFFVPVVLYVCYYAFFKGKAGRALCGISLAMLVCVVILYVFWYNERISNYDYYRNYAVLWLFGWLLAALALDISAETKELPQFFSYAGLIAILAVLALSGGEESVESTTEINGIYATRNLFSLYRYNVDCLSKDYGEYRMPDEILEVCEDVVGTYSEFEVPILTEDESLLTWYDALTDNDSTAYSLAQYGLPEVVRELEIDGIDIIAVSKDTEDYQSYRSYFEQCREAGGNDAVALYETPGDGWTDIYRTDDVDYEEKQELFSYVKEMLGKEQVPLMAGKESCLDFIMYEDVTGIDSAAFYTWKFGARENIANLKIHDVKYVTLLKDDSYYIASGGYYTGQDIVFENEAGMVVRCIGDEWIIGKER